MKVSLYNVCFVDAAKGSIEVHTVADISARDALKTAWDLFGSSQEIPAGIQTIVKKATDSVGLDDKLSVALSMLAEGREKMESTLVSPSEKTEGYALARSILQAFFKAHTPAESEAPATVEGEVLNNG